MSCRWQSRARHAAGKVTPVTPLLARRLSARFPEPSPPDTTALLRDALHVHAVTITGVAGMQLHPGVTDHGTMLVVTLDGHTADGEPHRVPVAFDPVPLGVLAGLIDEVLGDVP
jgi:hypothetical protein